jgi:multidrug efflux pump subunit AcrB
LSQVASVQYKLEQPSIWRRDLLPTITVHADVIPGIEAKTVNAQLAPALAELETKLPAGYTVEPAAPSRKVPRG